MDRPKKKKIKIVYNIYDDSGNKIVSNVSKDHADLVASYLNRESKN